MFNKLVRAILKQLSHFVHIKKSSLCQANAKYLGLVIMVANAIYELKIILCAQTSCIVTCIARFGWNEHLHVL